MKKIALIMESWVRNFTYAWASGIMKEIRESGAEISLYIFNASANWSADARYNQGEHNIFQLPDLHDFDGVILDLNNTRDPRVINDVENRVREAGIPAVVIGNEAEGMYSVGVDNYGAMKKMIDHLYTDHGRRSFWFVMGPEENYENKKRAKALMDYVEEKGMTEGREYRICYGDFDVTSGREGYLKLRNKSQVLPEAVICANDNIAVGVLEEAEKEGYHCPEDFLITGFDDLDKARFFNPRISTVSYVREHAGILALKVLQGLWKGEEEERVQYISSTPIFWESCGCTSEVEVDTRLQMKNQILWNDDSSNFMGAVLRFSSRLAHCDTVKEMLEAIPESVPAFRCDGITLVMDSHFLEMQQDKGGDTLRDSMQLMGSGFVTKGYPEEMRVGFTHDNRSAVVQTGERVDSLFPAFAPEEPGDNFLFLPLHFREQCVGYLCIRNAVYLMKQQFLFEIVNALMTGMEQLYQKRRLARQSLLLRSMVNRDPMTYFYNRLGYAELGDPYLSESLVAGRQVLVAFFDLDRLKLMNDTYGHEIGDTAIRAVADELKRTFGDEALCFRLGGDEFLVLRRFDKGETPGKAGEETKELLAKIRERLTAFSEEKKLPIPITVSAGYRIVGPGDHETLEFYVRETDHRMYEDKKSRRVQR